MQETETSRIRTRSLAGISAHSRAAHSRQSQVTRLLSQAQRSSGTVTTCVKETLRKALGQQGICSICRAPAGTRGSIIDRLIPTPVGGLSLRGWLACRFSVAHPGRHPYANKRELENTSLPPPTCRTRFKDLVNKRVKKINETWSQTESFLNSTISTTEE